MADIKWNDGKIVFGEDGFEVNSGDVEKYGKTGHDETNALETIGAGSKKTIHLDPTILPDDGYIDLPAETNGRGFILVGDGEYWVDFEWDRFNTVLLIDGTGSTNPYNADEDDKFCVFDNTDSVRIKNRLGAAKRIMFDAAYTEEPLAPTFRVFNIPSGVDNLDPELTINSITVEPTFRYFGGDADATNWVAAGYGETLTRVSVATPPTYNTGSPGLGDNDDSVLFNKSDYYQYSTDTDFGDIGTEDIVFELVVKPNADGVDEQRICGTRNGGIGWRSHILATGTVRFLIMDSGGYDTVSADNTLGDNAWYHMIWFIDRSGSGICYTNGVSGTASVCSSISGSLANGEYFTLGNRPDGGNNKCSSQIAYISMWKSASWLDTHLQATVAAERFAKFCGIYPEIANGTYMPTTSTRACNAYIDKMEGDYRKLYYVGSEWLRMCRRWDSLEEKVEGYLSEIESENVIVESEDFLTTWTLRDAGDTVLNDQAICPDGRTKAASIAADSTDGNHGIKIDATLTADTYAYSIFVKPGSDATYGKDWCVLWNTEIAKYYFFDIANGVVGTGTGGSEGYIEGPFYSGDSTPFYRVCLVFTGTATSHSLRIYPAESDTHSYFSGDGSTPNIYVWGAQCELGDYMTSPIITDGGVASRLADSLVYVAGDNIGGEDVGQGTVALDVLFSDYDKTSSAAYFYWIGDGTTSADRVYGQPDTSDNFLPATRANGLDSGDPGAPAVDIVDGIKHSLRHTYEEDSTIGYVDGLAGTEDTSCDIPDDVDTIFFARNNTALLQPNSLIQNFRIYGVPTTTKG